MMGFPGCEVFPMAAGLVFEDFKDRVGGLFTPCDDEAPTGALTLAEARLLPARFAPEGVRPPFSLIFLGPDENVLPQKLYRLRHEDLGEVTIFLVPVGRDAKGVSYQAVFN
jgi:hypothetical protein